MVKNLLHFIQINWIKYLRTRSLDEFKAQQTHLQRLDAEHIKALTEMCNVYNAAIRNAYDFRIHPEIEQSLHNMVKDFKTARRQDPSYTLPDHTPAWRALRKIDSDFKKIADEQLWEHVHLNHDKLNTIMSILEQSQSYSV